MEIAFILFYPCEWYIVYEDSTEYRRLESNLLFGALLLLHFLNGQYFLEHDYCCNIIVIFVVTLHV